MDLEGHIVTNFHVVKGANKIEVLFAHSKKKVEASIVGTDRKTDLALLKVNARKYLHPVSWGNSDSLKIGDVVLAIGNPFGFSHTVTSGIISAMGRVIGSGPYDHFLQTDASIHPGNSGGPLLDVRGRVIGINTAVSAQGSGIGFAIPINRVKSVIRDLKKYGKVKRPWLGIVGKNILSREDVEDGAEQSGVFGVIVSNLIIDGPANKAGIRIGDLLMMLDREKIFDLNTMQRLLSERKPSQKIRMKIYRRSKGFMFMNLSLQEVPKSKDLPDESDMF